MKNSFKKLVCTALSGILFVSAAALPSFAKKEKTPLKKIEYRPMFRLYNTLNHEHFYTESPIEKNTLTKKYGWVDEGIGWTAPSISKTPVYRLYNPILRDHHYTTSKVERDKLVAKDHWIDEGIGWYSDDNKGKPLYRQFAPFLTSGSHNYTTDPNERKVLTKQRGWVDEGVSWYGAVKNTPKKPVEDKFVVNYDFSEDDVKKMVEEMGFKYNYELDPRKSNTGWWHLVGVGSEIYIPDIYNIESVRETITFLSKYGNNEFRLIKITPENMKSFDNLPDTDGSGWKSIFMINKDDKKTVFEEIKNGSHEYVLCYM